MNREYTATPKGYTLLHNVEISQLYGVGQRIWGNIVKYTGQAHFTRYLATALGYTRYYCTPIPVGWAHIPRIHLYTHTHIAHALTLPRMGDLLCTLSAE